MSIPALYSLFHAAQFGAVAVRNVNYPLYQNIEGLLHGLTTQASLGFLVLANVAFRKKDTLLSGAFLAITLLGNRYDQLVTGIAAKNLALPDGTDASFSWSTSEKEERFRRTMLRQILANVALACFTPYQRTFALCATMSAATYLLTFNWVWLQKKTEVNKTDDVPQFRVSLQALFDKNSEKYLDEEGHGQPLEERLNKHTELFAKAEWVKKEGWFWDTWSVKVDASAKEAKILSPKVEVLTEGKRFFIRTGWTEASISYTK